MENLHFKSCTIAISDRELAATSLQGRKWTLREMSASNFDGLIGRYFDEIDTIRTPLLARLLKQRAFTNNCVKSLSDDTLELDLASCEGPLRDYLQPSLSRILSLERDSDLSLPDLAMATRWLTEIRERGERVGILTDYDADGANSAALLIRCVLEPLEIPYDLHVPDRVREGYGPNVGALQSLKEKGASLIFCLDCGSGSKEVFEKFFETERATLSSEKTSSDVRVVILDHHPCEAWTDSAANKRIALVNPRMASRTNPREAKEDGKDALGLADLPACGVVFVFALKYLRGLSSLGSRETDSMNSAPQRLATALHRYIGLTAIATVCDVMPLIDFGRILVKAGLKSINADPKSYVGVHTLARLFSPYAKEIDVQTLGYSIGPALNAGGRLGDSFAATRLLATADEKEAQNLAHYLFDLNQTRKSLERKALTNLLGKYDASTANKIVFAFDKEWHQGLVGILASRLKEKLLRPCLIGSLDEDTGIIKGSARSVAGINVGAVITRAKNEGLLLEGGGHAMAAGFKLRIDQVEAFSAYLNDDALLDDDLNAIPELHIETIMNIATAANGGGYEMLARLGPFGQNNPEPLIMLKNVRVEYANRIGKDKNTLRLTLCDEFGRTRMGGIMFKIEDKPFAQALEARSGLFHLAGFVKPDRNQTFTFYIEDATHA